MSQNEVKVMRPIDVAQLFSLCNFSPQIGEIAKNMVSLNTAPILQHHLLEEQLLSLNNEPTQPIAANDSNVKKKKSRKRNKKESDKNLVHQVESSMNSLKLNDDIKHMKNVNNRKNSQQSHKEHLQHHHNLHQPYHHSHHLNLHHKINNNDHQNHENKSKNEFQNKRKSKPAIYEEYWSDEQIKQGLADKILVEGKIRINQRNYEDAFVNDPSGGSDLYISGLKDRNRALNNDIVALKVKEKYNWKILDQFKEKIKQIVSEFEPVSQNESLNRKDSTTSGDSIIIETSGKKDLTDLAPASYSNKDLLNRLEENWFQRTAIVVGIIEKKNNRYSAGHLKLFPDKNKEWAQFSPNDSRVPRMRIQMKQCPKEFYTNPQMYANTIFIAKIIDIPINSKYATGQLKKMIGREGDIEVETEAILIENGIDYNEFDECINECLPKVPWYIPQSEYDTRRDLRNYCLFTIDPATARDLDDALHCIQLDQDTYEIGVHIADVSYFVKENSLIDKCAAERATSVYLVQKVIPMLPRLLCEELCSLNPAVDRLTFSVIWKIKSNGDIIEEWFGRTIINSVVKLSYEHAQMFIEDSNREFKLEEFPPIRNGFSLNDIKKCVLDMDSIAKKLRSKRYENGCLALNQVKINFVLNKECGLPYGYNVYEQKDSNRLVEEFMLLANIAVAHRIYDKYPQKAILRRHPTPNAKQIRELSESFKSHGFECDVTTSRSIQSFLHSIRDNPVAYLTLTCLLTKTMQLAQYFCSGICSDRSRYYHYGLAVPLYTHFTSPIRRYPDILVHRLLASSLDYCDETKKEAYLLQTIADNCNDKKYNARICSERSGEMFFSLFVNECGPLEDIGQVIQIKDHSFDVLLVNLGIARRIYCDRLNIVQESVNYVKNPLRPELSFLWEKTDQHKEHVRQSLQLFSTVNVILNKHDSDCMKFNIVLKHPNEPLTNRLEKTQKYLQNLPNSQEIYNQRIDTDPYVFD